MRGALLLHLPRLLLACLLAAPAAQALAFQLQPDGGLLPQEPPAGPPVPAVCQGDGVAWDVGSTVRFQDDGGFAFPDPANGTALEMDLHAARLAWVMEVGPDAAGPATLTAEATGTFAPLANGSASVTLLPGRNTVTLDLPVAGTVPPHSAIGLHVALAQPTACLDGDAGVAAVPGDSRLELEAEERLELWLHPEQAPDRFRLAVRAVPSWGAYMRDEPVELNVSLDGPGGPVAPAQGDVGPRSAAWAWDLAGAAPGAYKGNVAAFLIDSRFRPTFAHATFAFHVAADGSVQGVEVDGHPTETTVAPASEAAPGVPLLPLLGVLASAAVAARYSSARRSATALRTSLPWYRMR